MVEKIYKCDRCGAYFKEPVVHRMEPDTGYIPQTCPDCESEYYSEVNVCRICGNPTDSDVDEFCPECIDMAKEKLDELSKELFKRTAGTDKLNIDYEVQDILMQYYGVY